MKGKWTVYPIRINGLSVVMMLILLCLSVFGLLSLSTAGAQRKLSMKNAQHAAAVSLCEADAEQLLAAACNALAQSPSDPSVPLRNLGFETQIQQDGTCYATAQTTVRESLSVYLCLRVEKNGSIRVEEYRLVSETDYTYDPAFEIYGA